MLLQHLQSVAAAQIHEAAEESPVFGPRESHLMSQLSAHTACYTSLVRLSTVVLTTLACVSVRERWIQALLIRSACSPADSLCAALRVSLQDVMEVFGSLSPRRLPQSVKLLGLQDNNISLRSDCFLFASL